MSAPDNPAAFPWSMGMVHEKGMTLRDFFAGQIIGKLVSRSDDARTIVLLCEKAYLIADTLLHERAR